MCVYFITVECILCINVAAFLHLEVIVYTQFIITTGCTVDSLLDTDRDPECSKKEGDMCTCTVMSSDGGYGMMYDGTSVGSTAHLFTNNSYCYNRPQILERTCQDNGQWSGETVNTTDIVTGVHVLLLKSSPFS